MPHSIRQAAFQISMIVLATACGANDEEPNAPEPTSGSASWAFSANTIAELKAQTDFGVLATVSNIEAMTAVAGPPEALMTIDVDRVLWHADGIDVPPMLSFAYTPHADPPTASNDRWILYFQEYEPGKYRSFGPSGWFAVAPNGMITTVPDNPIELPAHTSVDDFAKLD